jgi:hypothetical protein
MALSVHCSDSASLDMPAQPSEHGFEYWFSAQNSGE